MRFVSPLATLAITLQPAAAPEIRGGHHMLLVLQIDSINAADLALLIEEESDDD